MGGTLKTAVASEEPRFTPEEVGRLGEEIYEKKLKAILEPAERGRIVAIDVTSGNYALGETRLEASDHLKSKQRNPEIWFIRVGERALYRI